MPPFSGIGTAGGDDAESSIAEGEGDHKKQSVQFAQREATHFPVFVARIFQHERGVGQNLGGIHKIDAVFFQVASALGFVPLEFHVHHVTPFCSYVKIYSKARIKK